MFRPLLLAAAVAAVVALAPGARAADEPKDVIAKAIKAHGGEKLLASSKAGQIKAKGKIDIPGAGEAEFTQETSFMMPDKYKDTMELKVAGQTVTIFTLVNDGKFTAEVNGKAVDVPAGAKDSLKDVGHVMEVSRLITLKDKGYEVSLIGEDKVAGKKVIGVRVAKKDHKDVSLYFDAETWLIAKVEYRTTDATSGNEITEERLPSGYEKNKDGTPVPKKIVIKRDGKQFLEAEVLEAKYFEKLDDSEFKK